VKPAVFLDRDGTIIEHVHHLRDPADVRLIPGAGPALRSLREAGYQLVLVTNQSVIGRGLLSAEGLNEIHETLSRQLRGFDVEIGAFYHCPVVPVGSDRMVVEHSDRKPGPGMLLRAAREHNLDLGRSWMVGDSLSDALAGRNAGCWGTILVRTGWGVEQSRGPGAAEHVDHVADDLAGAARWILASGAGRQG